MGIDDAQDEVGALELEHNLLIHCEYLHTARTRQKLPDFAQKRTANACRLVASMPCHVAHYLGASNLLLSNAMQSLMEHK